MVGIEQTAPTRAASVEDAPFLSLVIPAYNEARRLGPTLEAVLDYLARRPYPTELIIVNDGSTDATEAVARDAIRGAATTGQVQAHIHAYSPNAGKGRAVRTGVLASRGRYVGFVDADLSTPLEEIDRALAYLDRGEDVRRYRIVIGSRAAEGADIRLKQPVYRRLSARFFNVLRDGLVGVRGFRDTQCGLKLFDGDLARRIFARQRIDGFMFDVETIFIAQRMGIRTLEMGVRWTDMPESKVKLSSGLRLVPDLLRIRWLHGGVSPSTAGDTSRTDDTERRR